jgi:hypothetical protein
MTHATLMDVFTNAERALSPFIQEGTDELKQKNDQLLNTQLDQMQANVNNFMAQHRNEDPSTYADELNNIVGQQFDTAKTVNGSDYYQQRLKGAEVQFLPSVQQVLAQAQIKYNYNKNRADLANTINNFMSTPGWTGVQRYTAIKNALDTANSNGLLTYAENQQYDQTALSGSYAKALGDKFKTINGAENYKTLDDALSAAKKQVQDEMSALPEAQDNLAQYKQLFAGQDKIDKAAIKAQKQVIAKQFDNNISSNAADFYNLAEAGNIAGANNLGERSRKIINNAYNKGEISGDDRRTYMRMFPTYMLTKKGKALTGGGGQRLANKELLKATTTVAIGRLVPMIMAGKLSPATGFNEFQKAISEMTFDRWCKDSGKQPNEANQLIYNAWAVDNTNQWADALTNQFKKNPAYKDKYSDPGIRQYVDMAMPEDLKTLGLDSASKDPAIQAKIKNYVTEASDYLRAYLTSVTLSLASPVSPKEFDRLAENAAAGYIMNITAEQYRLMNMPGKFSEKDIASSINEMNSTSWAYTDSNGGGYQYPGNREAVEQRMSMLRDMTAATFNLPSDRLSIERKTKLNSEGLVQGVPDILAQYGSSRGSGSHAKSKLERFSISTNDQNQVFITAHYKNGKTETRRAVMPERWSDITEREFDEANAALSRKKEAERPQQFQGSGYSALGAFGRPIGWQ